MRIHTQIEFVARHVITLRKGPDKNDACAEQTFLEECASHHHHVFLSPPFPMF
jgi:hypothetical protein